MALASKGRKEASKNTNKRRDLIKPSTNFVIREIKVLLKASCPKIQCNKGTQKVPPRPGAGSALDGAVLSVVPCLCPRLSKHKAGLQP